MLTRAKKDQEEVAMLTAFARGFIILRDEKIDLASEKKIKENEVGKFDGKCWETHKVKRSKKQTTKKRVFPIGMMKKLSAKPHRKKSKSFFEFALDLVPVKYFKMYLEKPNCNMETLTKTLLQNMN